MGKIAIDRAAFSNPGAGGIGLTLINTQGISIMERSQIPGAKEKFHYHRSSWQFFYILSGEGSMKIDDELLSVSSGDTIEVAPLSPHQLINTGLEPLKYLVISKPDSTGDRVEVE